MHDCGTGSTRVMCTDSPCELYSTKYQYTWFHSMLRHKVPGWNIIGSRLSEFQLSDWIFTYICIVDFKSLATSKLNSGKPKLIYQIWIWLSFPPQHALPLCSSMVNQLWFPLFSLLVARLAIWCIWKLKIKIFMWCCFGLMFGLVVWPFIPE